MVHPDPDKKGFSLVEIMVVISIIGILSGLSLGFVGTIQKNTRDAQRESDLRVLQSAIQQFYADQNYYPNDLRTQLLNGSALTNPNGSKTYLSQTPKDPNAPSTTYCYTSQLSSLSTGTSCASANSGMCHFYELCAELENTPGIATCACNTAAHFKVTPL